MAIVFLGCLNTSAQRTVTPLNHIAFFDSIDNRISSLETQIARLKQTRDARYLNAQRELEHTLFEKKANGFILDENLDLAKALVEEAIKKSEFRKDQASVKYYYNYQEKIYSLIKEQRMFYQALFKKGNNLSKQYKEWISPGNLAAYQKTTRMIDLALKYARENNLEETIKLLEMYRSRTEALIFDEQSDYDLALITSSAKNFERVFMPLVESDSLSHINEAEQILKHTINYAQMMNSPLSGEYFQKKSMLVASAMSDLLDRQGREKDLARYTDRSVVVSIDTLNPCGVFKWHDQIVVIDEFQPTSSMENVRKGEAIIHADRMLATYLRKNNLCKSDDDLKFGYSFIVPFKSLTDKSSFYFNKSNNKWQFIAVYTVVVSPSYTTNVSRYMPPLFFENEMNTAQNFSE